MKIHDGEGWQAVASYTVEVSGTSNTAKIVFKAPGKTDQEVTLAASGSASLAVDKNNKKITIDLAKEMIDKYVKSTAKEISIEFIQKVVSDYFKIPIEDINWIKSKTLFVLRGSQLMAFRRCALRLGLRSR